MSHEQSTLRDKQDDGKPSRKAGRLPRVHFVEHQTQEGGNAFGYSLLVQRLKQAVQDDQDSKVALTCCTPAQFVPVPGKKNIVLSMWEEQTVASAAVERISKADVFIAPSRWCAEAIRPYLPSSVAIEVVNLGVDPKVWKYKGRRWPDGARDFRWLWNAAPNARKGYGVVAQVWGEFFSAVSSCELYVKTSVPGEQGKVVRQGNLIFDSRRLPVDELVALYESAHGFVYPSLGEGAGLTIMEAMASGLPAVSTAITGHGDFVNHATANIIDVARVSLPPRPGCESVAEDGQYDLDTPLSYSCAIQMGRVMTDYKAAKVKARRASNLIHAKYTWPLFTKRINEVITRYGG